MPNSQTIAWLSAGPLNSGRRRHREAIISAEAADRPAHANSQDCTPEHPLGAPMVSTEGACAAYHAYGRHE